MVQACRGQSSQAMCTGIRSATNKSIEPCTPFRAAIDPRPQRKAERREREEYRPFEEHAKADAQSCVAGAEDQPSVFAHHRHSLRSQFYLAGGVRLLQPIAPVHR